MRRNLFLGVVLITLGTMFLLNNFGIADFGDMIHDYWPLILIIWGLSIVMRDKRTLGTPSGTQAGAQPGMPPGTQGAQAGAPAGSQPGWQTGASFAQSTIADLLHESNLFGNVAIKNSSQNFLGGSVSTVFGDGDLDLSDAVIAEGEHVLRVHGVFGDSMIILPRDAAVSVTANSTFGSVLILGQRKDGISSNLQVSTPNYASSPRRLQIIVSKVFGSARVN